MNELDFKKLDLHTRMGYVVSEGDYIAETKYFGFKLCLYIVEGNYIEVFYNLHKGELEDVAILDPEENRLHLYTGGLDISDLLKVLKP